MSRLVETTLHLINEKHAWATEVLDSLVDAHRRSVTDVPPVTAWMVGMGAIAGMVARIERPEYHEDVLVGLLALAVGRLAEDGEAR